MKILFLLALATFGQAQLAAECLAGEFANDGFTTGQNIELNYQGTQLQMNTAGDTEIQVGFFVPKVYSEKHMASAFQVTFNREAKQGAPTIDPDYGVTTSNDKACYNNRGYTNGTDPVCDKGENSAVWRNDGPVANESPCVDQMFMTISWTEAITNEAFGNVQTEEDGEATRMYMMATVETWRKFDQGSNVVNYLGQMTGSQQLNSGGSATDRTGTYWGDAGDLDPAFDFGPLLMNDWRYTLYQIPFYLKFPKTVVVSTDFVIGSPIAVLSGVVQQDVVSVNMNPTNVVPNGYQGATFANLDVTITTEVQYPYAVRAPTDGTAPMQMYIGSTAAGGGTHAEDVSFVRWDDPASCGANQPGQICQQRFTVRIQPTTTDPCTVAGDYFVEFWAKCFNENQCGISDDISSTNLATQRQSQAYFNLPVKIAHQSFCPEVVDTVHVAVDLTAYHDESFEQPISNQYNGIATDYTGGNEHIVYTNDVIFYEAQYRTASDKSGQTVTNNGPAVGDDTIIDYVRAVKIFVDVHLGVSAPGVATGTWDGTDWKANLNWVLGGSRVPGPLEDFDDSALTVTGTRVLTVPASQPANSATWTMILCEVDYILPDVPIRTGVQPADCFTAATDIAKDFLDFTKIETSKGTTNTIDENEVAFAMRMDERVIPIGPNTDNSYVTVTLESEVYYKGNKQPSRRLLQAAQASSPMRKQTHKKNIVHSVFYKPKTLKTCKLDEGLATTTMKMTLDFGVKQAPELDTVNDWSLNMKAMMEKHMKVKDVFTVTEVEKCDASGCNTILDEKVISTRRVQSDNLVHLTVEVQSAEFSSAGQMVNTMQAEIATRKFTVADAEITHLEVPDCGGVASTNTKLASSSAAWSLLASAFVAVYSLLL